jgi:hypothetical protein
MATKVITSNHLEIFKKAIVEFGSPIKFPCSHKRLPLNAKQTSNHIFKGF